MSRSTKSIPRVAARVAGAFLLGLLGLVAGAACCSIVTARHPELIKSAPWLIAPLNHTGMLIAALVLILILSRGRLATYGFRLPTVFPFVRLTLLSAAIAAVGFAALNLLPAGGLGSLAKHPFFRCILFMWIYASVAEEVLARGLVQGFLTPLADRGLSLGRLRLSLPVLASAVFFSATHLLLLTMRVDLVTVLVIVLVALLLGLLAGYYRERSGSLIPAIVAHTLANLVGTILAILWPA